MKFEGVEPELEALESLPSSVVIENNILPLWKSEDGLHVAFPDDDPDEIKVKIAKLEFLLEHSVVVHLAPPERLKELIQHYYPAAPGIIDNCDIKFQFKCPEQWDQLTRTSDPLIRHCNICDKHVYLSLSAEEVAKNAAQGRCIAVRDHRGETMGIIDMTALDS